MTVISEVKDSFWHEELLTIQILNHGSCHRNELNKQIRKAQETKQATFPPHSTSSYNSCFRALKNRGIVNEEGKILSLTNLGRWVAAGSVGTLFVRNEFANLACDKCSNDVRIVLRTPFMDTLTSNSQDDPFIDVKCLDCGSLSSQVNLGYMASKGLVAKLYNQAFDDMGKFVTVAGLHI
jgi:hypothetical protein